jgi:hypothetical protein
MMTACFFPVLTLCPTAASIDSTRHSIRCNCITNPNGFAETGYFLSMMTYASVMQAVRL